MPKQKFQRKQYVVDKQIQYRFARFVMFFVAGVAFLTSTAVFFTIMTLMGDKLASVYPQGRLAPIVRSAYISFFVILGIALPIMFVMAIRFSHRIVGPLPKIYRYLTSVGEGNYPGKLHIRQGDELYELVDYINQMSSSLEEKKLISPPKKPSK